MKKIGLTFVALCGIYLHMFAQNTFPPSGNVGIGTDAPKAHLHVRNSDDGEDQYSGIRIIPAKSPAQVTSPVQNYHMISGFRRSGLWIAGSGAGSNYTRSNILLNDDGIMFGMSDGYINPEVNSALSVLNNGNIGIGTVNPKTLLHLEGKSVSKGDIEASIMMGRNIGVEIQAFQDGNDPDTRGIAFRVKSSGYSGNPNTEAMRISSQGNLLINKTSQANLAYKLDVEGKIRANEIVVNTTGADFVFESEYKLPTLEFVEQYIKENKHLPEIPSVAVMQEEGMSVGELNTKLLQKVEELTLYIIEQNNVVKTQSRRLQYQSDEIRALKVLVEGLQEDIKKLNLCNYER